MTPSTVAAGFALGLAGSAHCIVMCGGVAAALDRTSRGSRRKRITGHALYSVGRLTSYALLGAVAGALGSTLVNELGSGVAARAPLWTRVGVGLLLILLGVGLAGLRPFQRIERLGLSVWRRLRPLSRRVARLPEPWRPLALGALWGFLPCAMVYGASAVAAATATPLQGACFMAAFGVGTLPAVLSLGAFASGFWERLGRQNLRRGSAVAVVICGVWTLLGSGVLGALSHAHH